MIKNSNIMLISLFIFTVMFQSHAHETSEADETIVLSHVLFRHGDRNPSQSSLYRTNPYYDESFYSPYGFGHLTNEGRQKAYELGFLLRNRYGKLIGDTYYPELIEARSTRILRAKMSLELLLASLFPPNAELEWKKGFRWQPIPYIFEPKFDKELYADCPRFPKLYNELVATPMVQAMDAEYQWVYDILSANTNESIKSVSDVFFKYFGVAIQDELGFPLESWKHLIYPQPMKHITIDYYYLMTNTTDLIRVKQGYFLRKIIQDMEAKINGTLTPSERKLFLYSAHEQNVATLLLTLGIFEPHLPPYSSYVAVELHQVNEVYGIKIYYEDYSQSGPRLMKLPDCDEFCSFDQFYTMFEKYIPTDEECYDLNT